MIVKDAEFSSMEIEIDGKTHISCVFRDCVLVYSAQGPVGLEGCTFEGCSLDFRGSARTTMQFLHDLQSDPFLAPLVDKIFKSVLLSKQLSPKPTKH